MQFTSISFEKLFPTGAYMNEKIRVDMIINPGEDAMEALQEARKLVNENFEKNNPHLVTPDIPIIPKRETSENTLYQNHDAIPEIGKLSTTDKTIMAIKSFTELKGVNGLESFKLIVKGKPELEEAYAKKYMELQMNGIANNNELMTEKIK